MRRRWISTLVTIGLAATAAGIVAVPASAEMRSKLISRHLCKTIGGGRFVDIPHFPGERIDRRLLADIRWMRHRYEIFITDGYSTDPVHAPNGEHPIGLALDIVPNKAAGGTWNLIGDLAHRAEPRQNEPRPPCRGCTRRPSPGIPLASSTRASAPFRPRRNRRNAGAAARRGAPRRASLRGPPRPGGSRRPGWRASSRRPLRRCPRPADAQERGLFPDSARVGSLT
jgi:hypothetical protein